MFGALKKLQRRIARLDQDKILKRILSNELLQAQVIDLVQKQLYEQGTLADGTPTGEYAPITISYFKPKAASEGRDGRTDHITLKDTGEFYRSMEVESLSDGIMIIADTVKNSTDLAIIYPHMLGLTPESKGEILPEIRERILDQLRQAISSEKIAA